ncbi:MAG: hypothetical protein Q7J67_06795, partial [bacterium]|nr:hypothetical protein [bacterium]
LMKHKFLKHRYGWPILVILGSLIFVVFMAHYSKLSSTAQVQPSSTKNIGQIETEKLPRIKEVVYSQQDDTLRLWIKQASVIPAKSGFRMENVKTLYSGFWSEGTTEYSISPDKIFLLVSQETRGNVDRKYSNLLLVSLPSGKVKTLRGDGAGYSMLGWSSDSQLISYISPIFVPFSNAFAPMPSGFQFISYVSNKNFSPNYNDHPPDEFLYISAADGKWRRKVQAEVADAVWIPGRRVIVYTSYDKPGLVVYSSNGKKTVLSKGEGGGNLLLSGDGKKMLWQNRKKLRLLQIPLKSSKLLDPKAWKTVAMLYLDPNRNTVAMGLSYDGKMVVLRGPDIQTPIPGDGIKNSTRLAVLNLATRKFAVYSLPGNMSPDCWTYDEHHLVGGYSQLNKGGRSTYLAAIRIDPSSINHSGPIDWVNPQPITPQILLEMPNQTRTITWRE